MDENPDPVDYPLGEGGELTEKAGGVPAGTAPEAPAALGTSESLAPVSGVHTPDAGPSGDDFDTDARPLPK